MKQFAVGEFEKLSLQLGYTFKDPNLLLNALTYPAIKSSNELDTIYAQRRLEFLGDGLLYCAINETLFDLNPPQPTTALSKIRGPLIANAGVLYDVAQKLELINYLKISDEHQKLLNQGHNLKLLSNTVEAILGAIFIDSDRQFAPVREFVKRHWTMPEGVNYARPPTSAFKWIAEPPAKPIVTHWSVQLYQAVQRLDIDLVHYYLEKGADPNIYVKENNITHHDVVADSQGGGCLDFLIRNLAIRHREDNREHFDTILELTEIFSKLKIQSHGYKYGEPPLVSALINARSVAITQHDAESDSFLKKLINLVQGRY